MTHQLARLDIDPGMPYVAMHMRLGGQLGEDNAVGRYEPMKALRAALSCARQLRSAMLGGNSCGTGDPPADPSLCAAAAGSGKQQRILRHTNHRSMLSEEEVKGRQKEQDLGLRSQQTNPLLTYRSKWDQPLTVSSTQQQQSSRQMLLQRSKVQLNRQEGSADGSDGSGGAGGSGQQQHGAPIVVITDNLDMKSFVNDILGPHVVTTNVTPHHWGANQRRREQADLSQFVQTVGDMGVLAKSSCLIISRGGFGYHAFLWGRHSCVAMLDTCKHPDHPY